MQRTQIYLEENMVNDLKEISKSLNISVSEFIRKAVQKEIKKRKSDSLNNFLEDLQPLESFKDIDSTKYVEDIRSKSRLLNE